MTNSYFFVLMLMGAPNLQAAYQEPPPKPVIQYRPQGQKNITTDEELRKQMNSLDAEIQLLIQERQNLRTKADRTQAEADEILNQYQQKVDEQRRYESQMQQKSDNISQLVRKKADISRQLKK